MTEVTRVVYKSYSQSDPRIYMDQTSKDLTVARGRKRKSGCSGSAMNPW